MSNNSSEPRYREFWIYDLDHPDKTAKVVDYMQRGFVPSRCDIHVIEKSAFTALKAENEQLKELLSAQLDRLHKAEALLVKSEARLSEAEGFNREFLEVHDEPCRHDHHGYCQSHFLEEDCLIKRAREYQAKYTK